jgi:dihydroxyacetone kinase
MADAAVLGEVFAAPSPPFILDATRAANGGKGVLYSEDNRTDDENKWSNRHRDQSHDDQESGPRARLLAR